MSKRMVSSPHRAVGAIVHALWPLTELDLRAPAAAPIAALLQGAPALGSVRPPPYHPSEGPSKS
jgi:hypothetical protein